MSKRHLSKRQNARIKENQQHSIQQTDNQTGLLIAHYGVYVDIEADNKKIYRCNLRQNLGSVVPGDRVIWQPSDDATGILVAILPRRSLLSRPVAANKVKLIAANLDQVIVVIAPQPKPPVSLIDSYLVAIETLGLKAVILCNKEDLLECVSETQLPEQLAIYRAIGYPVLTMSAKQSQGFKELKHCLNQYVSVLVGQSGVGKTSIINTLLPEVIVPMTAADHAKHTTTTARLYHIPGSGDLIDSPGVRDFKLWTMSAVDIAKGFKEFQPFLGQCQFRDCQHLGEKNCALHQAVIAGNIAAERLLSYQRIIEAKLS